MVCFVLINVFQYSLPWVIHINKNVKLHRCLPNPDWRMALHQACQSFSQFIFADWGAHWNQCFKCFFSCMWFWSTELKTIHWHIRSRTNTILSYFSTEWLHSECHPSLFMGVCAMLNTCSYLWSLVVFNTFFALEKIVWKLCC